MSAFVWNYADIVVFTRRLSVIHRRPWGPLVAAIARWLMHCKKKRSVVNGNKVLEFATTHEPPEAFLKSQNTLS